MNISSRAVTPDGAVDFPFLAGGGEVGERIRANDWARSPLGPPAAWPQLLRTSIAIMLASRLPMFVAWGPELTFLCNAACEELVGREKLGLPLAQVWGPAWKELSPLADRAGMGEAAVSSDLPIGNRGWFVFSMSPLREEDGRIAGVFTKVHDVTDRHTVEEKLRESEQRFRLIADSAPAPMWVSKLDRKRNFVNRAYIEFLGITYDEAVDFDWRTVLHPDDHDRIVAESMAGEAALKPFALEARYRRADGEWRWIRSISQPRWGANGEHAGFIGVAVDITDSKRGEEALREVNETLEKRVAERTADLSAALDRLQAEIGERERAEEALRQAQKMEAVGQLTGGIAHDFNNLLTPVVGGLEMIARSVEDPRLKRIAEAALESSRRGAKLTGQLLAFSRLQRIRMAPVAVNRVIAEMNRIISHTIGPKIEIRTELSPHAGHAVCDENQLENAILNLAINARDAMPDGGVLTVSTALAEEPGAPDLAPGAYVCVSVADTGCGMSPEITARAVEPFFSTKPLGKGTGLGLAQVYGIVRQSGGAVRIESEENRGTTVRLLLPRAEAGQTESAGESGESTAAAQAPARGASILLVDDDPDVLIFLAETLEGLGHVVQACPSAEEALQALAGDAPDLLLVDFAMPGMNGAELARAARGRHSSLPIVFVTGFAETEQMEAAIGPDVPVLKKPFGIEELAATVVDALREDAAT